MADVTADRKVIFNGVDIHGLVSSLDQGDYARDGRANDKDPHEEPWIMP
ncbi:hypothetical protein GCM10009611_13560 [Arthrobacter roseus]